MTGAGTSHGRGTICGMQVETRGVPEEAKSPFKLEYDPVLPITAHRMEILEAIQRHPVIVLCGATGSGKSTQLPKLCVEAGRGTAGMIGHTQPRRIAARALANRLAEETGTTVGGAVGYKVRFNDRTGPDCRVKLMTDGILLKELESDRQLRRYDTLIIDEAHERSLNIDLLLGVLKQLVPKRPDLRLIVTSATIDPGRFSTFFGGAPVIEVSGRSYPVEILYRPLMAEDEDAAELSLPEGIIEAVRELDVPGRSGQGSRADVLVFLPGEKHIREAADALERARLPNTEVLPLFARLSTSDQERIFQRHSQRRVVLATNVAETSLTVPGIRFVIDSGLARISRYSVRGKVQRLPIEPVSKASADQRKGRCGREAEGICIRLYSEEDFVQREDFTPPEVLRTNLASVMLRMATLGLGEPESFPFLDPPDTRLVNDGVRLLQELKAMDEERRVTSLGQQIAGLPVDPRLGRMLLAASRHNCLTEMLVVVSFLEGQDPRERPTDAQQQASEKHSAFADPRSDFVTVLNVWRAFNEQSAALSRNQLRKWCRENFLSFLRMREWQDLHTQLSQSLGDLKLRPNQVVASYTDLHQAILTGFLGSIGELDEKREYNGPRGMRFVIAPGTPLASKPPKWVVAGSLLETTKLYARMVAAVDPGWIEAAGAHLLKRSYSEPHWVETRGFVSAYESVALYGLTLASKRRINYGAIAPREAREIFIREALIEPAPTEDALATGDPRRMHRQRAVVQGEFLAANRRLRDEIEGLEAKIRRRDVIVDEEQQLAFYTARIPERVNSISAFNTWRAEAERGNPRLLYMSRADLVQRDVPEAAPDRLPDELPVGANQLPLQYKFEPAEAGDGITLTVPEPLLEMVSAEQIAWLVPGMRLEKVIAVFRALPKAQRKLLVPVPEHAKMALDDLPKETERLGRLPGFYEWLARWVTQRVGAPVTAAELAALPLPDHLRMNLRVVDADDGVLAEGRDLLAIKRKLYATTAPGPFVVAGLAGIAATGGGGVGANARSGSGAGIAGATRTGVGVSARTRSGAGVADGVRSGAVEGARTGGSVATGGGGGTGAATRADDIGRGAVAKGRGSVSGLESLRSLVAASGHDLGALRGTGDWRSTTTRAPATSTAGIKPTVASRGTGPAASGVGRGGNAGKAVGPGAASSLPSSVGSRGGLAAAASAGPIVLHRQWDFGDLPESREVERNRLRLVVYPAVEDHGSGVAFIEARNALAAEAISRVGLVRLAILALPQQAKYVSKRATDDRELVLLSRGLPLIQSMADALTQRAFRECFLPVEVPLPRNQRDFNALLEARRAQLSDVADRLAVTTLSTLKEWRAARAALDGLRSDSFPEVVADINAQLAMLLPPDFIESTPRPWFDYLARYFKAITRRIERLPPNARRDAELAAKVKPFAIALRTLVAQPTIAGVRPELEQLRWMIEEFRVSLFAQDLKTMLRVSEKRLAEQLSVARASLQ
ncbi:MAG: ATP-dependent helicase HrpA [Gammaproteobacteria bacterium]|nr:ATP-dependent helicase HrpA [Gammaproteobacteria bacterium]